MHTSIQQTNDRIHMTMSSFLLVRRELFVHLVYDYLLHFIRDMNVILKLYFVLFFVCLFVACSGYCLRTVIFIEETDFLTATLLLHTAK